MTRRRAKPRPSPRQLRSAHRREHREHQEWSEDLERWRAEYRAATAAFARRALPELELEAYEAALEAHEVAIEAHEEMLRRHDRMLTAEERGGPVTSDDMTEFQAEVGDRHDRSRAEHERLESVHRAVLRALAMMGGRR